MPWFKVDDALALHMKAITAGNTALGLWVRAGSWSMHQLSDGFIPAAIVTALGGTKVDTGNLVGSGLWDCVEGGFLFHDWAVYQPTREQVLAEREAAAERMRRVRANKQANEHGTNADRSASPSRPVPSPDSSKTSTRQSLDTAPVSTDSEVSPMTKRLAAQAGVANLTAVVEQVAKHTGRAITADSAFQLSTHLLGKAKSYPKNPQAYVTRSISLSPFEVQQFIDEQVA